MLDVVVRDDDGASSRLILDEDRLRCFTPLRPRTIRIVARAGRERQQTEAFLEASYGAAFDGHIRQHYPNLMCVQDDGGDVLAAVGFRFAAGQSLYLEHYLEGPAEHELGRWLGEVPSRDGLVEIGNLASAGHGASVFLFLALADHLRRLGCSYALATATGTLRRIFRRMRFETLELGRADAARLPGGGADWGRYYSADPVVVAGAVAASAGPLERLLAITDAGPAVGRCSLTPEARA